MKKKTLNHYSEAIKLIKNAILKSRYHAAVMANKELLSLYYGIGKYVSENSRRGAWGTSAIETISKMLQQELPGLRGFSPVNIKRMRQFYEAWEDTFAIRQLATGELQFALQKNNANRPIPTDEIQLNLLTEIRPMPTDEYQVIDLQHFLSIGFSHHYELLIKTDTLKERLFYIERCAVEFWSVENLRYNIKSKRL